MHAPWLARPVFRVSLTQAISACIVWRSLATIKGKAASKAAFLADKTTEPMPTKVTAVAPSSEHLAAIDGLRGIACLAVVAHHCYWHCGQYQWPHVAIAGHSTALSRVLLYGNGGVELFFIVSGFCLAYPLCCKVSTESWTHWFIRRAYRILPPYYASALLFCLMFAVLRSHSFSLFGMTTPPQGPISLKGIFACASLLNAYFNPSYWTLVLEAKWYLLFPLLVGLWRRAGSGALFGISLLVCSFGTWLSSWSPRFVFLSGQVTIYLPIFAAGMLIARWTAAQTTPHWLIRSAPWGLALSIALVAIAVPSDGSPGVLPPAISWGSVAFFMLLSVLNNDWLSSIARTRALVAVGAFSYSLYLIHEPIVHLAYGMLRQIGLTPAQQFAVYECVLLPICVVFGYAFYRLVELPTVQWGRAVFKRQPLAKPNVVRTLIGD